MSVAVASPLEQGRYQVGGSVAPSRQNDFSPALKVLPVSPAPSTVSPQNPDRHSLLLLHLPQVRMVAKSIWGRLRFAVELDDLVGYGTIGLLRAVERFDPHRGILLKTYAEHRIRGAILDGLRGMDWLPRSARQKDREQSEESENQGACGHAAPSRTKSRAGPKGSRAPQGGATRPQPCHLPRMKSVFTGGNLGDLEKLAVLARARSARRDGETNPESLYECKQKYDRLAQAISQLPRRHREIVTLYYQRELSMKQIGAILRVHESRVSQLHSAAITRLRKVLAGNAVGPPTPCKKPPQRYSLKLRERDSNSRLATIQSSSVSTPMVS
ncbi:MAG: sigma-70 family RNA polymerase sigma factor [Acidobacteria bacterium]|nr:sigma-70 family RNA polymerase sigma factor [Acidobacteriota bacterium]